VGGKIDLSGDSQLTSQNNCQAGLFADNGGSVSVSKSTLTNNDTTDVSLSFGTRAEFTQNTIGTITCDATASFGVIQVRSARLPKRHCTYTL
jgi:hypothetical protein